MSYDGADEAERYGGHDDKRLNVAFKLHGQEREDAEQGEDIVVLEAGEGFSLLFLFTFEFGGEARVFLSDCREDDGPQVFVDVVCGDNGLIDIGCDRDDAFFVDAIDLRISRPDGVGGDVLKGNFRVIVKRDLHVLDVVEALALGFGESNHDSDFITVALYALGFRAVECATYLFGKVIECKSECSSCIGQGDFEFSFPGFEGVIDLTDAVVVAEFFLEFIRSLLEGTPIVVCKFDIDAFSG